MNNLDLENHAIDIANNSYLSFLRGNDINYDEYVFCYSNMNCWLSPTIERLKKGLNTLNDNKGNFNLSKIIYAFEENINDEDGGYEGGCEPEKLFAYSCKAFCSTISEKS